MFVVLCVVNGARNRQEKPGRKTAKKRGTKERKKKTTRAKKASQMSKDKHRSKAKSEPDWLVLFLHFSASLLLALPLFLLGSLAVFCRHKKTYETTNTTLRSSTLSSVSHRFSSPSNSSLSSSPSSSLSSLLLSSSSPSPQPP